MSYVDDIRSTNDTLLSQADEAVDDIKASAPDAIRDGVQKWVDNQAFGLGKLVPDGLVDEGADIVIDVVMTILDQCDEAITALRAGNQYLGSPESLRAAAEALGELGTKADTIKIDSSRLTGLLSWDDPPASRVYNESIESQSQSLARIAQTASSIGDALDTHADDIENYYIQLALIVAGAVVTILGVVAAVLGLIGALPTGGVSLAASIIGLITAVIGIGTALLGIIQMVMAANQGTASKLDSLPSSITEWTVPAFAMVR
jgi:hypothetical protein